LRVRPRPAVGLTTTVHFAPPGMAADRNRQLAERPG
jgi:hypothetical protein